MPHAAFVFGDAELTSSRNAPARMAGAALAAASRVALAVTAEITRSAPATADAASGASRTPSRCARPRIAALFAGSGSTMSHAVTLATPRAASAWPKMPPTSP